MSTDFYCLWLSGDGSPFLRSVLELTARGELLPRDELKVLAHTIYEKYQLVVNVILTSTYESMNIQLSTNACKMIGSCNDRLLQKATNNAEFRTYCAFYHSKSLYSSGHLLYPSGNSTKLVRRELCFQGLCPKPKARANAPTRPTIVRRHGASLRNIACQDCCLWQNWHKRN